MFSLAKLLNRFYNSPNYVGSRVNSPMSYDERQKLPKVVIDVNPSNFMAYGLYDDRLLGMLEWAQNSDITPDEFFSSSTYSDLRMCFGDLPFTPQFNLYNMCEYMLELAHKNHFVIRLDFLSYMCKRRADNAE